MRYARNPARVETINRRGQTADLPLFESTPETAKVNSETVPKVIALATDTRNEAHRDLTDFGQIGKSRMTVYKAILELGPSTNAEIAAHLGWPVNRVTGRTFELRCIAIRDHPRRPLVVPGIRRVCWVTGNFAREWKVNG